MEMETDGRCKLSGLKNTRFRGMENVKKSRLRPPFRLTQTAPASILLNLCGIGIFLAFQPEAEPIYISLLGTHSFPRLHQWVISVRHVYQVHWLCKPRQSREPFPFEE